MSTLPHWERIQFSRSLRDGEAYVVQLPEERAPAVIDTTSDGSFRLRRPTVATLVLHPNTMLGGFAK